VGSRMEPLRLARRVGCSANPVSRVAATVKGEASRAINPVRGSSRQLSECYLDADSRLVRSADDRKVPDA
jgi:hypothetical protein